MLLSVLGVPVEVESASKGAAELSRQALARWRSARSIRDEPALRLCVSLGLSSVRAPGWERVSAHVEHSVLSLRSSAGWGWADPARGKAGAYLRSEAVDRSEDAAILLESLVVYLAQTAARPVILHAAGLVWRGKCVLVTGEEGAGKSTLSYACIRAAFGFVSEDACFAAAPDVPLRVWGLPWSLSLLPDAVRLFPELCGAPRASMLNGETKLRVELPRSQPEREAVVAGALLLRRTSGESMLLPVEDVQTLSRTLVMRGGPARPLEPSIRAADLLAAGPSATLQFGRDIERAVELVRGWAERL